MVLNVTLIQQLLSGRFNFIRLGSLSVLRNTNTVVGYEKLLTILGASRLFCYWCGPHITC